MEHRHFARKPHQLQLQIMTRSGRIYQAQMLDLSSVGMRVVTDKLLPAGANVPAADVCGTQVGTGIGLVSGKRRNENRFRITVARQLDLFKRPQGCRLLKLSTHPTP